MRVYLSARFERQAELKRYAVALRAAGLEVTSHWLDATADDEHTNPAGAAVEDLLDVLESDVLIAFTDKPSQPRGGRHVEFGIAIGLSLGMRPGTAIRLIVCGPIEHVFHSLPGVEHVDTWPAALALVTAAPVLAAAPGLEAPALGLLPPGFSRRAAVARSGIAIVRTARGEPTT